MNQKARALLRKITFLFILLGFIDYLVAYGLPHWAKYTSAAGQIHRYGLFMTCIEDFIKSECDTFHIESVDGKTSLLWRFHFILSDFNFKKNCDAFNCMIFFSIMKGIVFTVIYVLLVYSVLADHILLFGKDSSCHTNATRREKTI